MEAVANKQSFWAYLTGKPKTVTVKFFDPLKIKVHASVRINTLALEGKEFFLESVSEYTRQVGTKAFVFTDYNLRHVPVSGEDIKVKLRIVPIHGARDEDGQKYNMLLLVKDYEDGWSEGLDATIQEAQQTKRWIVHLEGPEDGLPEGSAEDHEYFRMNDNERPVEATVGTIADDDNSGTLEANEITHRLATYWDFGREVPLPGGNSQTEFYFVEYEKDMDGDVERVLMWKGTELNEAKIVVV